MSIPTYSHEGNVMVTQPDGDWVLNSHHLADMQLLIDENAALKAKVARLSAPVSDEVVAARFHLDDWGVQCVYRNGFDEITARRAGGE